jgi:hypothetical protein
MQNLVRVSRLVSGLLLAALAAVVVLNVAMLMRDGCSHPWRECLSLLGGLAVLEYLVALPFAAIAGLLFFALRRVGLLAPWHLAAAGALVSVLGGVIVGSLASYFSAVLFMLMGVVASAVFRAVVLPKNAVPNVAGASRDA